MDFNTVTQFELDLAKWWGSPYAVATDCCTHAIELCLRYTDTMSATCPQHTYISVPFTFEKLGIQWSFRDLHWEDYYSITDQITDSAVYWQPGGYLGGLQCLSFQFKKPLNLGRGGAILCDTVDDWIELKKLTYDGRIGDKPWAKQPINSIGYHYNMTPETAQQGIDKLPDSVATKSWGYQDYPDLTKMPVFG